MTRSSLFSRASTGLMWLGLLGAIVLGIMQVLAGLKLVLACLILFVSALVHSYSIKYLAGDRLYHRYFLFLFLITLSSVLMVTTDHIWLLALGWILSNLLLVALMLHKAQWKAARESAILAAVNLGISSMLLVSGICLLVQQTQCESITRITSAKIYDPTVLFIALGLIALAAFMQSAQWPFHQWLLSSLNSPTPVSALMHAGLVNGGGVLLAIFSPLFLTQSGWMVAIFIIGAISAIMATYWKLVQNSVKRMLACSTMAQMGFMMMQCGLGFYSAAVVHLCWHGLFKAYLFLSSPSAIQARANTAPFKPIDFPRFLIMAIIGLLGVLVFSDIAHEPLFKLDTTVILLGFAFMATAQSAYIFLLEKLTIATLLLAVLASVAVGFIYGLGIAALKILLAPSLVDMPQSLNGIQVIVLIIFILGWAIRILGISPIIFNQSLRNKWYVGALNASQPLSSTLTMKRNEYAQ